MKCQKCGESMREMRQFGTSEESWVCLNPVCGYPDKTCECGATIKPEPMGMAKPRYFCTGCHKTLP